MRDSGMVALLFHLISGGKLPIHDCFKAAHSIKRRHFQIQGRPTVPDLIGVVSKAAVELRIQVDITTLQPLIVCMHKLLSEQPFTTEFLQWNALGLTKVRPGHGHIVLCAEAAGLIPTPLPEEFLSMCEVCAKDCKGKWAQMGMAGSEREWENSLRQEYCNGESIFYI